MRAAAKRWTGILVPLFERYERALFVLWAAVCVLASARSFYGYML
jgi:hypothetical protein